MAELGLRFFEGVGLRGLGNVEFKRDARDGRLKLIECNHRFTAATGLMRAAGLDLPLFVYNKLTDRPLPTVDRYRAGLTMWYPMKDVRASPPTAATARSPGSSGCAASARHHYPGREPPTRARCSRTTCASSAASGGCCGAARQRD